MKTEEDINHFIWLHERLIKVYKEFNSSQTYYLNKMKTINKFKA